MDRLELYNKLVQNSKIKRLEPLKGVVLELGETFSSGFFDSTNFTYKIVSLPTNYFFHTNAIIDYIESQLSNVSKTVGKNIWSNVSIVYGDKKFTKYNGELMMSENVQRQIKKEFDSIKSLTDRFTEEKFEVGDIKYAMLNSTLRIYIYTSSPFDDDSFDYSKEFSELDRIYDIFNERVPSFEMEVFLKERKK
jgi:hypothetical protein